MIRLTIEKKVLLVIATCVAVVIAIVAFIIVPFVRRINDLNRQTYDLRVYLEKKHQRAVNFSLAIKTLEKIAPQTTDFANHIYHSDDALKLITALEGIASADTVTQKINSSNLDSNNPIVTLSLQASGNYQNVLQYVRDLEALDYFLTIRKVQLSSSADQVSKTQIVSAVIDISLYAD